jgi:hypothetical protein
MLWVPKKGALRVQHNLGGVGTTTPGTSVSTGATSAAKGTPVELITSTSFESYWMTVLASGYHATATNSRGCLDILIGASTEEVLIPNLLMGRCGGMSTVNCGAKRWDFPLYTPAGSRIAAQVAGQRTTTAMRVAVILYGGDGYPPWRVGSKITTYGIGTVPSGTAVTPGASGAEGSFTQVTASTSEDHFAFAVSFQTGDDTTFTPVEVFYVDLGVGAATEELLGGDEQSIIFRADTDEANEGPVNSMPIFADVPSGTRLSARISSSGAAQTTGVPEIAIHAVS